MKPHNPNKLQTENDKKKNKPTMYIQPLLMYFSSVSDFNSLGVIYDIHTYDLNYKC